MEKLEIKIMEKMFSESEEEVWDLAEIFNEIDLNKEETEEEIWDLASI